MPFGKHCIGGMPTTNREKIFKDDSFNSFTGCFVYVSVSDNWVFKQIKLNEDLHKSEFKSHNVEADCPTFSDQCEVKKSQYPVYIKFDLNNNQNPMSENIAMSFSSISQNGVLFYRVQDNNQILLRLKNSALILTVYETSNSFSIRSTTKNLNDNKLHQRRT